MKNLITLVFLAFCIDYAESLLRRDVMAGTQERPFVCKSNGGFNIEQFFNQISTRSKGRKVRTHFPCKYWALRQQNCGPYRINVSPGLRYIYPRYYLDTLWFSFVNRDTKDYMEARTTNKKAVKFYNTDSTDEMDLFTEKDGNASRSIWEFVREDTGLSIQDTRKDADGNPMPTWRVSFRPWDPDNKAEFAEAEWKFECFESGVDMDVDFPTQFCGNGKYKLDDMRKEKGGLFQGLKNGYKELMLYYHLFDNTEIVQTSPQCINATELFNTCKDEDHKLLVMKNCMNILFKENIYQCVTRYTCDPMDVFNACLAWGCKNNGFEKTDSLECEAVGKGIDFCPDVAGLGNLSERVENANCYKDFLRMRTDL